MGNPRTAGIQKRMRFEWFPRHVLVFRDFPCPPQGEKGRGGGNVTTAEIQKRMRFERFQRHVLVFRDLCFGVPRFPSPLGGGDPEGEGAGEGEAIRTAGIQNRATARGSWILKTAPEAAFRNGVALLTC